MNTRDQDEQNKGTEETEATESTEDTEGHVYVPKDERAGGVAGLPEKGNTVGPISDDDQLRYRF
jgi:hypothetical protein